MSSMNALSALAVAARLPQHRNLGGAPQGQGGGLPRPRCALRHGGRLAALASPGDIAQQTPLTGYQARRAVRTELSAVRSAAIA